MLGCCKTGSMPYFPAPSREENVEAPVSSTPLAIRAKWPMRLMMSHTCQTSSGTVYSVAPEGRKTSQNTRVR